MTNETIQFFASPGAIKQALDKIKTAATPERVTTDFLTTKLGIKPGPAKAMLSYLKRIGFVGKDGKPSELYSQFRNPTHSRIAAAKAFKKGYSPLYEMNEYVHELSEKELKGLIVQATGLEEKSRIISLMVACFNSLKAYASFETVTPETEIIETDETGKDETGKDDEREIPSQFPVIKDQPVGLNLSYTINLNLPATSDISVFNAIFKSLRENLLKK